MIIFFKQQITLFFKQQVIQQVTGLEPGGEGGVEGGCLLYVYSMCELVSRLYAACFCNVLSWCSMCERSLCLQAVCLLLYFFTSVLRALCAMLL